MANFSEKRKLFRFPGGSNKNLMETLPMTELQADPVHHYVKMFFKGTFFLYLFVIALCGEVNPSPSSL